MAIDRRGLLALGGTVVVAAVAGCSGDSSIEEIETGIQETNEHLEAVDPKLEAVATRIDNQNWAGCFTDVETIHEELDAARQSSDDALALAEENGHSAHATVLERQQEYIDILAEMADEVETVCEAGQNGNGQEMERRWQTVQELDDERHAKRKEIQDALSALQE